MFASLHAASAFFVNDDGAAAASQIDRQTWPVDRTECDGSVKILRESVD